MPPNTKGAKRRWVNLADLAAAGKPDGGYYDRNGINRQRPKSHRIREIDRDHGKEDRPDYRYQEDRPDREDDEQDVE